MTPPPTLAEPKSCTANRHAHAVERQPADSPDHCRTFDTLQYHPSIITKKHENVPKFTYTLSFISYCFPSKWRQAARILQDQLSTHRSGPSLILLPSRSSTGLAIDAHLPSQCMRSRTTAAGETKHQIRVPRRNYSSFSRTRASSLA